MSFLARNALLREIGNNRVVKITASAAANVAACLLADGPSTALALAQRLSLTGTAVRKHLDSLMADGLVESSERAPYGPAALNSPRGRGRPAKVFSLTPSGREIFGSRQESIGLNALRYIKEIGGEPAVATFAARMIAEFVERHQDIAELPVSERGIHLAQALSAEGFAASITNSPLGAQLCQHNCPMDDLATEFPVLCELETQAFSSLTGVHVTRLATIAKGDALCTTLIPNTRRESA